MRLSNGSKRNSRKGKDNEYCLGLALSDWLCYHDGASPYLRKEYVMEPKWNQDTLMDILNRCPELVEIGTDNDGQLIIYTGLHQNENGDLESMDSAFVIPEIPSEFAQA